MVEYIVKRWYNDGYDEEGIMHHAEDVYPDYESAKSAYASALACCEDAYEVELIRHKGDFYNFTMASSRRSEPRRIILGEDWLPEPWDEDYED